MLRLWMLRSLTLLLLLHDADSECDVNLDPPRLIGEYGTQVVVNCSTDEQDHDGIRWRLGDTWAEIEKVETYISLSVPLTDWNITAECSMELKPEECSKNLEFIIYKKPTRVVIFPMYENAVEGTQHELQCDIQDVAPVQHLIVKWFKNDKIIKTNASIGTAKTPVNVTSTLKVDVNRTDHGAEFRCEAELDLGPDGPQSPVMSENHTLSVHYAPVFKDHTHVVHVTVNEFDDVTLSCAAEGNPPPEFNWTSEDMIGLIDIDSHTDTLNITAGNSTNYNCTASNVQGTITKQIYVDVKKATAHFSKLARHDVKKIPLSSTGTAIIKTPDSVSISTGTQDQMVEGKEYQLNCDIFNVAPVQNLQVMWYQGNEMVYAQRYNDTTETPVNVSSTFTFTPERKDNDAIIRCEAELDVGPDGPWPPVMTDSFLLSVHYAPVFKDHTHVVHVSVNEFDDVTLSCAAEGNPPPEFNWTSEDMIDLIDTDSRSDTLNITAWISANYSCTANNVLGTITKQIYVDLKKDSRFAHDAATACPLKLAPHEVVVKYGDEVSVNCSTTSPDVMDIGWEAKNGGLSPQELSVLTWTVHELQEWTEKPKCFANLKSGRQCTVTAAITLYKTPDSVSIPTGTQDQMVEGKEYQLNCDIFNVAPVRNLQVKWYQGNEMVYAQRYNDATETPVNVSSTFTFTPERKDNAAIIRCEAELDFGPDGPWPPVMTDIFLLSVLYAPVFKDHTHVVHVTVNEFDDVTLSCAAEGNPPPEFNWTSEDMIGLIDIDSHSDTLNITAGNSTNYNCTANNVLGTITKQIYVDVKKIPPTTAPTPIIKTPDSVSISTGTQDQMVEGKEYQLRCDIFNVAPVRNLQVKWYQGNEMVYAQRYNDTTETPVNVSSTFTFTPKRKDNGAGIRCEAELDYGPDGTKVNDTTSPSYMANVHYKPVPLTWPARYICLERHCTLGEIPLRADGNPKPTVLWYYQEKEISASKPLSRSQSGKFTAEIKNYLGMVKAYIEVTFKYAPVFEEGNHTKEVSSGEDVTLHCRAEGNPSPTVQWIFTAAVNIMETPGGHQSNISITKATSTNVGVYVCLATNELGSVKRHVNVIMTGTTVRKFDISSHLHWILPVILIILAIVIIAVCIKSRKKQKRYSLVNISELPLTPYVLK